MLDLLIDESVITILMHARLNPLDGKYYGTVIEIVGGPLEGNIIEVWLKSDDWDYGGMEPSDRELAHWNISREEHNRLYRDHPYDTPVDISGGHYESIDTLRVATIIVEALNLAAIKPSGSARPTKP